MYPPIRKQNLTTSIAVRIKILGLATSTLKTCTVGQTLRRLCLNFRGRVVGFSFLFGPRPCVRSCRSGRGCTKPRSPETQQKRNVSWRNKSVISSEATDAQFHLTLYTSKSIWRIFKIFRSTYICACISGSWKVVTTFSFALFVIVLRFKTLFFF
jgi:hypothetical protein